MGFKMIQQYHNCYRKSIQGHDKLSEHSSSYFTEISYSPEYADWFQKRIRWTLFILQPTFQMPEWHINSTAGKSSWDLRRAERNGYQHLLRQPLQHCWWPKMRGSANTGNISGLWLSGKKQHAPLWECAQVKNHAIISDEQLRRSKQIVIKV